MASGALAPLLGEAHAPLAHFRISEKQEQARWPSRQCPAPGLAPSALPGRLLLSLGPQELVSSHPGGSWDTELPPLALLPGIPAPFPHAVMTDCAQGVNTPRPLLGQDWLRWRRGSKAPEKKGCLFGLYQGTTTRMSVLSQLWGWSPQRGSRMHRDDLPSALIS